jgi:hypothetical protein
MDPSSQAREVLSDAPQDAAAASGTIDEADKAQSERSARNILAWMAYLPKACVKTMIKMGWDRNT